jgi:hypothetical protein
MLPRSARHRPPNRRRGDRKGAEHRIGARPVTTASSCGGGHHVDIEALLANAESQSVATSPTAASAPVVTTTHRGVGNAHPDGPYRRRSQLGHKESIVDAARVLGRM